MTKVQAKKLTTLKKQAKNLHKKLVSHASYNTLYNFHDEICDAVDESTDYDGYVVGICVKYNPTLCLSDYNIVSGSTVESCLDNPFSFIQDNTAERYSGEKHDDYYKAIPVDDPNVNYEIDNLNSSDINTVKSIVNETKKYLENRCDKVETITKRDFVNKKKLIKVMSAKSTSAKITGYLKYHPCTKNGLIGVLSLNKNWAKKYTRALKNLTKNNIDLAKIYYHYNGQIDEHSSISIKAWCNDIRNNVNHCKNNVDSSRLIQKIKDYLYQSFIHPNNKSLTKTNHNKSVRLQRKINNIYSNKVKILRHYGFRNLTRKNVGKLSEFFASDINNINNLKLRKAYDRFNKSYNRKQEIIRNRNKRAYVHARTVFFRKLREQMRAIH